MAGVGETGVWKTGVWIEPLDFEGDFELFATADVAFSGYFAFAGQFDLSGAALLLFDGDLLFRGEFGLEADGLVAFDGDFIANPGQGIFATQATGKIVFAWVPDLGPPTGGTGKPLEGPASVVIPFKPGEVFVLDGVSGTIVQDSYGRLLVIDQTGQVMCILGPSGVELP